MFAGTKNHIIDRNLAMTLRQRLMEACSIRSECTDGEQFVALSALSQSSDLSIRATALELYQRAEFCLMPSGVLACVRVCSSVPLYHMQMECPRAIGRVHCPSLCLLLAT